MAGVIHGVSGTDDEVRGKLRYTIAISVSGCWEWTATVHKSGYGQISHRGKKWAAHRLSYTLFRGEIPDGMLVCHACDNRKCIRPDHLFLGTQSDNMKDCVRKGRSQKRNRLLTADVAAGVKTRLALGESARSIAASLSVGRDTINKIRNGKTYKDI